VNRTLILNLQFCTQIKRLVCALLVLLPAPILADTNSWSLASPDGRCAISVSLSAEGRLSYQVSREGKSVILPSPLGIRRDDQSFDSALTLQRAGAVEQRREVYELFAGITPRVDHVLNHRILVFRNTNSALMTIDLAASDEGVAFRYHFAEEPRDVRVVQAELTGFSIPPEARGWLQPYHAAGPYTPAYEDFYFNVSSGDPPPESRAKPVGWSFPALFNVPAAATWVLLTESGTDGSYCACHLSPDSSGGLYRIGFPLRDEHTKGQTTNVTTNPRSALPWTMPWRVIVLGKSAGNIATATLVTDLAPASRVTDTSWIKPGRASWAWWSYPDGPAIAERFNEFTDFAARMGWEYTLFDAGWWTLGLKTISSHAKSKVVAPLAWLHAADFYDAEKRRKKLEEMAAAGIRGVKVDFWCSDRQETIAAMHSLFKEAAERQMVVNLHGCTLPRGWQRTWPNFLTAEAVLGTESYFYESRYTEKAAELNTVLPFTRNAVGPMDYTPVACSPKKFVRTTTAAHELATALIFTSGIIHYADKPEFFESLPKEVLQLFRDAPARWDETRCLVGEPGRVVVFARRSGPSWFIAGINGTGEPLPVNLDLLPFKKFPKRLLIAEGTNATMQVSVAPLALATQWPHALPPRGGFILRMDE
jgi:alpha-glucosidase